MTAYDFALFSLEKWDGAAWVAVEAASVSYSASYDPDENRTLIIGSESLQIALSQWGDVPAILNALDVVRVSYDSETLGTFTVDGTTVTVMPNLSSSSGEELYTVYSCSAVGTYAAAMDTVVSWAEALPAESPIDRIERWVTVDGW